MPRGHKHQRSSGLAASTATLQQDASEQQRARRTRGYVNSRGSQGRTDCSVARDASFKVLALRNSLFASAGLLSSR